MPKLFILLLSVSSLSLAGCATSPAVQPWERNLLAQDEMQLVPDKMEKYFDDHIYFSRQGAVGGSGAGGGGGGGCGCN